MKITAVLVSFFLLTTSFNYESGIRVKQQTLTYSLCEQEFDRCQKKCSVKLIKGNAVAIGSYIKVFHGKELVTQGYIMRHVSGSIYILENKKDALDPSVCGGCCGDVYEINITKKQIWGC